MHRRSGGFSGRQENQLDRIRNLNAGGHTDERAIHEKRLVQSRKRIALGQRVAGRDAAPAARNRPFSADAILSATTPAGNGRRVDSVAEKYPSTNTSRSPESLWKGARFNASTAALSGGASATEWSASRLIGATFVKRQSSSRAPSENPWSLKLECLLDAAAATTPAAGPAVQIPQNSRDRKRLPSPFLVPLSGS